MAVSERLKNQIRKMGGEDGFFHNDNEETLLSVAEQMSRIGIEERLIESWIGCCFYAGLDENGG